MIKVRNVQHVRRRLAGVRGAARRNVTRALLQSASEMMSHSVVRIQTNSGSGKVYKRGKRNHIASAPGEYPSADFGELVRHMFTRPLSAWKVVWGNNAAHALPLETGTSRMAARPFMRPSFMALRDKAGARIKDAVREAVRSASRGG